jgi:[acyl-carrier-protein] S-malonyltransferase
MIAALFPGQGSQTPGMGKALVEASETAKSVFESVSSATGIDLEKVCFELDEESLRQTDNAQIALFTVGVASYTVYLELGGKKAAIFAGHSIGEYAALVASGVLGISDGAKLVQKRGELMAQAKSGGMSAVLGLDITAIESVLKDIEGTVVVANDNCPGQVVISGSKDAVDKASPALVEAGAKRVLPLNVSGAFHSPLMQDASEEFERAVRDLQFKSGRVFSNVTAHEIADPAEWNYLLPQQLRGRVRWTESVQNMISAGVTEFIEFGAGEVLCGMLKRIDKSIPSKPFRI